MHMSTLSDMEIQNETSATKTLQNRHAEGIHGEFPSMRTSGLRYVDENRREGDFKNQKSEQKEETYQQISNGEITLEMKMATRDPNRRVRNGKMECWKVREVKSRVGRLRGEEGMEQRLMKSQNKTRAMILQHLMHRWRTIKRVVWQN